MTEGLGHSRRLLMSSGNGLNHGIELRATSSPYKGRLVIARRYDCEPNNPTFNKNYAQSYVVYSDDQGKTWTAGDRLVPGRLYGMSSCRAWKWFFASHSTYVGPTVAH